MSNGMTVKQVLEVAMEQRQRPAREDPMARRRRKPAPLVADQDARREQNLSAEEVAEQHQ
jgi:hypothetical protein